MSEDNAIPGLRDFMAVSALSMISSPEISKEWTVQTVATRCYQYADALLIEREKNAVSKV